MSEEADQKVIMPIDLFNTLTSYLTSRPYNEVHQIITELRQAVQIVETPPQAPQEESVSDE